MQHSNGAPLRTTGITSEGFFSRLEEDEVRQRFRYSFRNNPQTLTQTSGTANGNHRDVDLRVEDKDKRFLNAAIGGEHELGSVWELDYAVQVNDNEQDVPNRAWEWRGDDSGTDRWIVDGGGLVDVTAGTEAPFDPMGLTFLRLRTRELMTAERGHVAGFNLRRSAESDDSYVKVGAKYTRNERTNDSSQATYESGAIDWTLAEFGHYGGVLTSGIDGVRRSIVAVDLGAANTFFDANRRSVDYFDLEEKETFAAQLQNDYEVDEQVLAGYLMANWDFGNGSIIAGVRAERTDVRSAGFQVNFERASASRASDTGSYTNVLPSLLARVDLTPQLVLRTAWTHTLGRPNYEQLAPISLLTREGSAAFLQIGNPDLKARESTNYDVALEWYFAPGGLLAAGVFRKRIENEIVDRFRTFDEFEFNGETFERFTITTTENAERSEVNGLEVSYQQQFDFLPAPFDGLGVALTYAALDSESRVAARDDTLPLTRQPDWTRNASLFYQKAGFELALAFSEADSYLSEISDAPQTDLYAGEYGRFDMRASYSIQDRYRLFFEWQNINTEPATEYQGGVERQTTQYEVYGQTWYIGVAGRYEHRAERSMLPVRLRAAMQRQAPCGCSALFTATKRIRGLWCGGPRRHRSGREWRTRGVGMTSLLTRHRASPRPTPAPVSSVARAGRQTLTSFGRHSAVVNWISANTTLPFGATVATPTWYSAPAVSQLAGISNWVASGGRLRLRLCSGSADSFSSSTMYSATPGTDDHWITMPLLASTSLPAAGEVITAAAGKSCESGSALSNRSPSQVRPRNR